MRVSSGINVLTLSCGNKIKQMNFSEIVTVKSCMKKTCNKCNTEKDLEKFHRCKKVKDGRKYDCKQCRSRREKSLHKDLTHKICNTCKVEKSIEDFYKRKLKSGGYSPGSHCKYCKSKYAKELRINNHEKYIEQGRKYKRENKEKVRESGKKYFQNNKEKINAYKRYWQKNLMTEEQRLAKNLRDRLRSALNRGSKKGSAVNDLGCTIKEFKSYLENKFYIHPETGEEMSWKNYGWGKGTWSIDHINELNNFILTEREQLLKAINYKNQQPLWFEDHLKKTANYIQTK